MKIELDSETVYKIKDTLMIEFLKDDLDTIKLSYGIAWHDDDKKYDKKLIKAYKLILDYYGVNNV